MYFGAKNINVAYGKKQIITELSVEIEQGKTTAIVGRNGSGKSTLLKALGRLIKFDGTVIFKDHALSDLTNLEIAKCIALLPQSTITPEDITVYELLALGRFPHQKLTQQRLSTEDQKVIARVLDETGLLSVQKAKVSSLSGGYQQRAWIAMTLVQDTEIILLDEPTTYLDINHQLELLGLLKMLAKKHEKTVVYVLHDLNQVARFADNVIFMSSGTILSCGKVEEVFNEAMIYQAFGLRVALGTDVFSGSQMIVGVKHE